MNSKKGLRSIIMEKFMTVLRKPFQEKKEVEEDEQNIDTYDIDTDDDDEDEDIDIKHLYLDDEPLSRELEYTPAKSIRIHYCLYKMVNDLNIPFLQFYMEKKDGQYSFPLFVTMEEGIVSEEGKAHVEDAEESMDEKLEPMEEPSVETSTETQPTTHVEPSAEPQPMTPVEPSVEPQSMTPVEPSAEPSTETDIIYNLCKEFFMKFTSLTEDESSKRYKGFVEMDPDNFVVVFDCTDIEINIENNDATNVILDEIINKKVIEIPITEFVTKFFEEHEYMKHVTDENNYSIATPSCLYMVDIIDGNKENVIKSQNTMSILDVQIEHPIFGNIYLFSSKPLENISETIPLGRYAVFTNKSLYMMNRDFELEDNLSEYKTDFENFSVVCFFEEGVKYYAVYRQSIFMEI